jgi:hypothetical protein
MTYMISAMPVASAAIITKVPRLRMEDCQLGLFGPVKCVESFRLWFTQ